MSDRYDVRLKLRGVRTPFVWRNIEADHPHRAIAAAFAENYWPEKFEVAPEPWRMTITVLPRLHSAEGEKEKEESP